jgi:hypothetical protein
MSATGLTVNWRPTERQLCGFEIKFKFNCRGPGAFPLTPECFVGEGLQVRHRDFEDDWQP